MTEKTILFKGKKFFSHWWDFLRENAVWGVLGLLMELGASTFSAAPPAAALAAGLSGRRAVCAFVGGAIGALLHGFDGAVAGLAAIAIVFAARILPDLNNSKLRAAERFFAAGAAVFFSRAAEADEPSQLLAVIIAALTSGVFALCVSLLSDSTVLRGFDVTEPRDLTPFAIAAALTFFALGALDYTYLNIGRLLMGSLLLWTAARRGLTYCAAIAVPGVLGLCAAGLNIGAGAAIFAFSAAASCVFAKYGKIARAAGFVFFTASAALVTGLDENSWRIITEGVISAAAITLLPIEKIKVSESGFSDGTVALMLRERLNFAADAIAGIGSGINAAADTLDRKYNMTLEQLPDRAADRCCRSCPNSMSCWGKHYELFKAEFSRLVDVLRAGGELTEGFLSRECAELCPNGGGVVRALSAEYSRYLSVMADERRIRELRRVYVDQLIGVRDILRDMGKLSPELLSKTRSPAAEKRAERILAEHGVEFPQSFVYTDRRGRLRFEAYGAAEPRVEAEYLGTLLSRTLGTELEIPQISGSRGHFRITSCERTLLSAKIGAYQIPRGQNRVCGDCYESFTDAAGRLYVILSDGMGSGSRARVDSAMACSVLSKLIKSGISLKVALETVNTVLMIKSADESFATLDICRIDLNSGECALYKAGAATTYIKSADKLVRATLSSPPAGSGGRLSVPAQRFTVEAGDVILMMTDGAAADEQWLSRELSGKIEPAALSERIAKAARAAEFSKDDDISVLALAISN